MASIPADQKPESSRIVTVPRVIVATTAMLTFISFWRAAAIVLNDLASSAYYAGGESESFIGKSAPWFILGVMLFSYCVRAVYVESCSMFVRGGVYRVVKEALGGTLAKFSVSALMFDYVLTGPISGVSAGQYLAGLLNELFAYFHMGIVLSENLTAACFAVLITLFFWWENIKGIPESSHKALKIMQITTVMVVLLIVWCTYTVWVRGAHLPPFPWPSNIQLDKRSLGWLYGSQILKMIPAIAVFVGIGHSVLAMSGEESLAQVYREIEAPKLPNLKKAGLVIFIYSLLFTSLVSFFAVMIIPDAIRGKYLENLIGGLSMNLAGPFTLRLAFHVFVVAVGTLILAGAVNTAIIGSNGVLNRVSEDGVLADWFRQPHRRFGTSHRIINIVVAFQILTIVLSRGDVTFLANLYAFGVIWSFTMQGIAVLVIRYTHPGDREYRVPLNFHFFGKEIPLGLALITLTLFLIAIVNLFTKPSATVAGFDFFVCHVWRIHGFGAHHAPQSRRGARRNGPIQCGRAGRTLAPERGRAPRQHSGSGQQFSRALPSASRSGPRQAGAPRCRRAPRSSSSPVGVRIERARSGAAVWKRRAVFVHEGIVPGGKARQDDSFGRRFSERHVERYPECRGKTSVQHDRARSVRETDFARAGQSDWSRLGATSGSPSAIQSGNFFAGRTEGIFPAGPARAEPHVQRSAADSPPLAALQRFGCAR